MKDFMLPHHNWTTHVDVNHGMKKEGGLKKYMLWIIVGAALVLLAVSIYSVV